MEARLRVIRFCLLIVFFSFLMGGSQSLKVCLFSPLFFCAFFSFLPFYPMMLPPYHYPYRSPASHLDPACLHPLSSVVSVVSCFICRERERERESNSLDEVLNIRRLYYFRRNSSSSSGKELNIFDCSDSLLNSSTRKSLFSSLTLSLLRRDDNEMLSN